MRHELSVLAGDDGMPREMRAQALMDSPSAPRAAFFSRASLGDAEGALIGIPLYIAAISAGTAVAAAGGTMAEVVLSSIAAGLTGAALGLAAAAFVARRRDRFLQKQLDRGGLLLWVHLRSPKMEKRARRILLKQKARNVHVHDIPAGRER